MFKISRKNYSDLFGITTGDSVRLGDTNLFIQVEKDYTTYGEESVFGGGKTLREGMGMNAQFTRDHSYVNEKTGKKVEVMDLVITNALIVDYTGIYKADIGIRDGLIASIGKSGNPHLTSDVDMVVGIATEACSGEGKIFTAGGLDTHVHFLEPEIAEVALDGGITTIIAGGTGMNDGSKATTVTPGKWWIKTQLQGADGMPVNVGFLGKGQGLNEPILEQIAAGACGLKIHEDWGATGHAIDSSLTVADKTDIAVSIHTDTLNESGFVEHTIAAMKGRVIHAYHTEGAGGGHAPDILETVKYSFCLPASTNPTLPYTVNTIAEHLDMLMVCHHLNPKVPEDVAFADSRIRAQTIAAEDLLHDMGAISITSSDTLAMGRIGEVATRTFQIADKMKAQFGALKGDSEFSDNNRVKRYISKYTINPAIAHGVSDYVGSIEVGKLADIVAWEPKFFGAKPYFVTKMGNIVRCLAGDPNASIPTCEPVIMRNQFASIGTALNRCSVSFVSKLSLDKTPSIKEEYGLTKDCLPVRNCRNISKASMKWNDVTPNLDVDAQTFEATVDLADLENWLEKPAAEIAKTLRQTENGKYVLDAEPETVLPLAQRYFLY
ncbi:urease subunit alpha [Ureaplasma zalophigenitalium]|uniref:Urease subunit alpha n=2 Tax=Ureaplasma zalophigenitalium TaxID=907723 RepID=A0ABT3BQK1_9BACT|nr:urease subunit alpha [Ureaplasma zalophigenitalium]MCV3754203.1 urease subunit alpha [Ureaplasma zalophigenitalium]